MSNFWLRCNRSLVLLSLYVGLCTNADLPAMEIETVLSRRIEALDPKDVQCPSVLESGAGVGRTAYYARMLGIDDYTIVDLPIASLASGYFLARTIGEDQVLLPGEKASNSKRKIKFLSSAEFLSSTDSYDLIINADSLTEMDPNVARAYWNRIESNTEIFLSINHEVNPFTVKQLIDESKQVAPVERMPYWMRRGYVEEVVRFIPAMRL